jgi:pimeloyl-ACP methyl ester carboxylesterase
MKGNKVFVNGSDMYFVSFGKGDKNLVIILGLGDGFKSIKGQDFLLKQYYREYGKDYRVYVFGRKEELVEGYSVKDMAVDQKLAIDILGLEQVYVMGISLGGMIAQQLVIDYPEVVEKLVLGVSISRPSATLVEVVSGWILLASEGRFGELMTDTLKKTYTAEKFRSYRLFMPLISFFTRPKKADRFIIQARACLGHDVYEQLGLIKCPTLVIGGDSDEVTGAGASEEMADRIVGSELVVYRGLGHGAFEEAKDFNHKVIKFLNS